ncbi:tetrahydroberberine oxidase-like [Aristolochia californica]|uniref:tetrahydroberberine oxidase-like n=1 Tax=Aristolochia californica TaxID=171875 RepID=UPI0035D83D5B
MVSSSSVTPVLLFLIFLVTTVSSIAVQDDESLLRCLTQKLSSSNGTYRTLHIPNTTSYTRLLLSSIKNLRFNSSTTPKPVLIVAPSDETQVQATVICCRKHGFQVRVRSGGHDYEGLSYVSHEPFVVLDVANLRAVTIDIEEGTAWVQTGATLGDLYYGISEKSRIHAFAGGMCPTVGTGGLISGGGIGTLMRKFGLAADNVIEALLVDAEGRILDRKSMGEDLFWVIRGGGGASFGVILSWKIRLVPVPPIVTIFSISRTLEEGATKILHRWQYFPEKCHENLFIRTLVQGAYDGSKRTLRATFDSLFLGGSAELLRLTGECFPELGLKAKDCQETTWIDSAITLGGYSSGSPREVLLSREPPSGVKASFKAKSDFVKNPISETALEGLWELFLEQGSGIMVWEPLGGKMSEIAVHDITFPHRKGNLYNVLYLMGIEDGFGAQKGLDWINRLYDQMTPHVSKHPRTAYLNYRDLDLGINGLAKPSYFKSGIWGLKYFKGNFKRLALVKAQVDKHNFFKNEQSVPPF